MKIGIPRLFKFDRKRKRSVKVDMYRIEGKAYEQV